MIIAIDGTASSGKSSIARELGKKTKTTTVGTGSLYRAITQKIILLDIDINDNERIKQMLETTKIDYSFSLGKTIIKVDGLIQDMNILSSPEVSCLTPIVASKDFVRVFVRGIQKDIAQNNDNIIVEGRDIGSVVFPNADFKFFIDADIETRAKRRLNDYIKQNKSKTLKEVIDEIQIRDEQDRQREISPLLMTSSSIFIDSTNKNIEQCVDQIIGIISAK